MQKESTVTKLNMLETIFYIWMVTCYFSDSKRVETRCTIETPLDMFIEEDNV